MIIIIIIFAKGINHSRVRAGDRAGGLGGEWGGVGERFWPQSEREIAAT